MSAEILPLAKQMRATSKRANLNQPSSLLKAPESLVALHVRTANLACTNMSTIKPHVLLATEDINMNKSWWQVRRRLDSTAAILGMATWPSTRRCKLEQCMLSDRTCQSSFLVVEISPADDVASYWIASQTIQHKSAKKKMQMRKEVFRLQQSPSLSILRVFSVFLAKKLWVAVTAEFRTVEA